MFYIKKCFDNLWINHWEVNIETCAFITEISFFSSLIVSKNIYSSWGLLGTLDIQGLWETSLSVKGQSHQRDLVVPTSSMSCEIGTSGGLKWVSVCSTVKRRTSSFTTFFLHPFVAKIIKRVCNKEKMSVCVFSAFILLIQNLKAESGWREIGEKLCMYLLSQCNLCMEKLDHFGTVPCLFAIFFST